MIENSEFLEKNECLEIYKILDDYLSVIENNVNNIKSMIYTQKEKLIDLNNRIFLGEIISIDILIENNNNSEKLLKNFNYNKLLLLEINEISVKSIIDNKKIFINFFKRVLRYYLSIENYEYCNNIQKLLNLLVQ